MIRPNEIMLGDYFLVGKDVKKYMFVASVNNANILFDYINNDGYLYESQREYIEPIPITKELLKIIGFKEGSIIKHYWMPYIDLTKGNDSWVLSISVENKRGLDIDIQYLHELQQAVRLITKKELKVELP